MPRRSRCLPVGTPCHITQRGVDRRETFSSEADCETYLRLLRQNLPAARVSLLGWCLMPNHVHLIAVPRADDSLALLLRRVHGRYAQYYNASQGRSGHLWQNRFFACALGPSHLWSALVYVDCNPLRAGLAQRAGDYRWSSAEAHLTGSDRHQVLDLAWWRTEIAQAEWGQILCDEDILGSDTLRQCTYAGKPFGEKDFVDRIATDFRRYWQRGRPPQANLSVRSHQTACLDTAARLY